MEQEDSPFSNAFPWLEISWVLKGSTKLIIFSRVVSPPKCLALNTQKCKCSCHRVNEPITKQGVITSHYSRQTGYFPFCCPYAFRSTSDSQIKSKYTFISKVQHAEQGAVKCEWVCYKYREHGTDSEENRDHNRNSYTVMGILLYNKYVAATCEVWTCY